MQRTQNLTELLESQKGHLKVSLARRREDTPVSLLPDVPHNVDDSPTSFPSLDGGGAQGDLTPRLVDGVVRPGERAKLVHGPSINGVPHRDRERALHTEMGGRRIFFATFKRRKIF